MNRPDTAEQVAFAPAAPPDERADALAGLQKAHAPTSLRELVLPPSEMSEVIEYIGEQWQELTLYKSLRGADAVPFPSKFAREGRRGMQSVHLDYLQITAMGDYWEKHGMFGFDMLRQMVAQTPVLNAVIMTRVRQVQRFCRVNESGQGPGFTIAHIDRGHELSQSEQESVRLLARFMSNCGWEFNPRARRRLHRESFSQFVAKLVRDSLVLDSAPIETELARDTRLGIDGLYAVDGATIRLCTEEGYQGDDEIFALQVVQGRISSAYTFDELIYEPRNPQSDVLTSGYGLAESELMVRVVTGFLNAMTYNIKGFDSNAIPKGLLHLTGSYDERDIAAFKRYWNSMVRGVQNAWALPVMVSKDQESKAAFEKFGIEFNEMYFSKWMTFLTSIICAIYGMSPAEINFDSFTAGNTSALSGSDTDEKIAASRDSGLWPLLAYFEGVFTDYVVSNFSEKYVFRWTGVDEDDAQKREERARLVMTVNEMRAQERLAPLDGEFGDAPINPSLTGIWMQLKQQEQPQDFGQPPGQGGGQPGAGQASGQGVAQDDDDEGGGDESDDMAARRGGGGGAPQDAGERAGNQPDGDGGGEPFAKANPHHDPKTGRFASGESVAASTLLSMPPVPARFDAAFDADFSRAKAATRVAFDHLREATDAHGFAAVAKDGRRIKFSGRGFKEVAQHAADRRVLSATANLPTLFTFAVPLYSEKPDSAKQQVVAFHYYGVKASFGAAGQAFVLLEVIERANGDFFYDADATSVEKIRAATSAPLANRTKSGAGGGGAARNGRLAQWLSGVNHESTLGKADASSKDTLAKAIGMPSAIRVCLPGDDA